MKKLIQKLLKYQGYPKKIDSFTTEYDTVSVYGVESDEFTLRYWNSSNSEPIRNAKEVLKDIASKILDNIDAEDEMDWVTEGEVQDGWNSVMFEIVENKVS